MFIYFEPIFAGIVTNFIELNNFPSPNLNTASLFLSLTFTYHHKLMNLCNY